jgi:hypothetical protein
MSNYLIDSIRMDFWLEDRTRPVFLDVIVARDRSIQSVRIRCEGVEDRKPLEDDG